MTPSHEYSVSTGEILPDAMMKKYEDAMIAIGYIIEELRHNNISDLALILEDITQAHMHTQAVLTSESGRKNIDEYQSILYIYFIEKYYNKIKIQGYKGT